MSAAAPEKKRTPRQPVKQPRPLWNGSVRFGGVSVPVSLMVARQREDMSFVMLHRGCGGRIVQPKRCSKHRREVKQSEIVKGFEFSAGHYVELEDHELVSDASKLILLDRFIARDDQLLLHVDSTYYLAPQKGEVAIDAYAVLLKALEAEGAVGMGAIVMYAREYPCAIHPLDGVLCLSTLFASADVRSRRQIRRTIEHGQVGDAEVQLACDLIDTKLRPFRKISSGHRARVQRVIRKKIAAGEGFVQAPGAAPLNLEKTLRESLKQTRGRKA